MYRVFREYIVCFYLVLGAYGTVRSQEMDSARTIVVFEGLDERYRPKQEVKNLEEIEPVCQEIITKLRRDGYWLASIDSVYHTSNLAKVYCYQGRKFDVIDISIYNEYELFNKLPHFPGNKLDRVRSPFEIEAEIEKILHYLEANGYPFAEIIMDSSKMEVDTLRAYLHLDFGTKITYDSLELNPPSLINPIFLSRYLGLDYDKIYDEQDLTGVQDKIRHLPFLTLEKMTTSFQLKKAKISLDLAHKKVNHFDGILGLVPDQDGEGVEVTGELDLSIKNLFKSGKRIEVRWNRLDPGSQQLHANYLHPILFGSPLDFYFAIDQIRQDTVYSNRSIQLAFDYRPIKNVEMRVSYENLLGNELDDQKEISGDFDIDYYGLTVVWYRLDQLFNPKKGFKIKWDADIGRKSIQGSGGTIPESTQYRLRSTLESYFRISSRSVLYLASKNGAIFNDYLYLNDLFRLGGLKSIRGFNELEFFASKYAALNLEWRYYLDVQSYLLAFYDQSFLSYKILNGSFDDRPAGVGIGMQFATAQGNFKILYGLGRRNGESFSFATSKIHFGYTAIF